MNSVYGLRRKNLIEHLEKNGLGKIIITNPLNICYFTGVKVVPYERLYSLVIDAENKSCHFLVPSLDYDLSSDTTIKIATYLDEDDPVILLKELISKDDHIGIEYDNFSFALSKKISDCSKTLRFTDIGAVLSDYRMIKSDEEIEALEIAVSYSDETFATIASEIKPGISEKECLSMIFKLIAEREGTVNNPYVIQVLGGEKTANPHGDAGDRRLQKGEPLTIDFGVCYKYYWSDSTRTFFAGRPDPRMEMIYKIVLEAQEAAISMVQPGVTIAEIDKAARQVIQKAGYGKYFIHRTGHGIGLDIHEYPKIHGLNDSPLMVGMTFTVEPGIYIPNYGGIRIEDDVLVTENGVRVLSQYPKTIDEMIISA